MAYGMDRLWIMEFVDYGMDRLWKGWIMKRMGYEMNGLLNG